MDTDPSPRGGGLTRSSQGLSERSSAEPKVDTPICGKLLEELFVVAFFSLLLSLMNLTFSSLKQKQLIAAST